MFDVIRPHRRRGARRTYRARCEAVRMTDLALVGEQILDLSPRGALLTCDRRMAEGQELVITFRSPWLGPDVVALGEVTRVVEGWRVGDPGYCAGLRFIDLPRDYRLELSERLAHLPLVVASRRHPNDYAQSVRAIALGCC